MPGFVLGAAIGLLGVHAEAFSLLGPWADWMQPDIGYRLGSDIGGPMDFDEGYRWNVPILTYGFDQTFLDYFGSEGVAAVESAIDTLNDLPPASSIVLSNYPLACLQLNYGATAQHLLDLRSFTLSLLLEHMGLAPPSQSVFVLRQWDTNFFLSYPAQSAWPPGTIPNIILMRNFDPETLVPTTVINGEWYTAWIEFLGTYAVIIPTRVGPFPFGDEAVAGGVNFGESYYGAFFDGLSQDDVGGLRYLLSSSNQNYETVLPDVQGTDTNPAEFVNGAWRPGVEKITFVRHPPGTNTGGFGCFVYQFTDTYITNGVLRRQHLERVIERPDFLFCAGDTGAGIPWTPWFARTDTAGWFNNAALNWDDPTKAGPGVIRPPVTITFQKLGPVVATIDENPPGPAWIDPSGWGSFDGSTNAPVVYPAGVAQTNSQLLLRLRLSNNLGQPGASLQLGAYTWQLPVAVGRAASLQASTNLVDWVSLVEVTNTGGLIEWYQFGTDRSQRFFRAVPQ